MAEPGPLSRIRGTLISDDAMRMAAVQRYIALLRGVNVSGKNRIAMANLRDLFAGLGYQDVRTYIQSGNVVFLAPASEDTTREAIEGAIARDLGMEVTVLLRTAEDLRAITEGNPFLPAADPAILHVTFLAAVPATMEVSAPPSGRDEYRIAGREIYLSCPEGYGNTKLTNSLWERRLQMRATTRNWRTVMTLLEMAETG